MVQPTEQPRRPLEWTAAQGDIVRRARAAHGWKQKELARRLGYSVSTISRIESGNRGVQFNELVELAQVLQIPLPEFGIRPAAVPTQRARGALASSEVVPSPAQLPGPPARFVGRREELRRLDRWLAAPESDGVSSIRIVVISGTAGVGKTTLARTWAHLVKDSFPDGNLHHDLRGFDTTTAPVHPEDALASFLQGLGAAPPFAGGSAADRSAMYRSHVAGKRLLVVLDNAESAAQVRPLLPAGPGSLVIVTSRKKLSDLVAKEGAHPHTLDPLPFDDAWKLLVRRIGQERIDPEPDAARDLIGACGRLPLTVTTVGATAETRPHLSLATLVNELRTGRSRLDALDALGTEQSVRAVLACSYDLLSEPVQRFFRLLAVHPGPDFTAGAAASITGVLPEEAGATLTQLVEGNLLEETQQDRVRLHDLFHELAARQSADDNPSTRAAAFRRMLDHYVRSAHDAMAKLPGCRPEPRLLETPEPGVHSETFSDEAQAREWFARERRTLTALLQVSENHGYDSYTWKLARVLDPFLDYTGRYFELESAWRAALRSASKLGNLDIESMCRLRLGHTLIPLGQHQESGEALQQAFEIRQSLGDDAGAAGVQVTLAELSDEQGDLNSALRHALHALELAEAAGDPRLVAKSRNACAWRYARSGDPMRTLTELEPVFELCRSLDDPHTLGAVLDTAGYAKHLLGRHDAAAADYTDAIRIWRDNGAVREEARSTKRLGDSYLSAGDLDAARLSMLAALELYESTDGGDLRNSEEVRALLADLDAR